MKAMYPIVPAVILSVLVCGWLPQQTAAQARQHPLTFEGANDRTTPSAAMMAAGGLSLLMHGQASTMLHNPALLTTLAGPQVSIGGIHHNLDRRQTQQYAPVRYYPNLSLLLEGLTDQIPDPDPDLFGFTPADSVQRAFDDLGPDWSMEDSGSRPLQAFAAVPFTARGVTLAAGIGIVEYGDFSYYEQNNNALGPNILSQRPLPMERPTDDQPVIVDWYQSVRSRRGSISGYGGALAVNWNRHNLSFGISGTYLTGSTEDHQYTSDRGRLTFFANHFRADSTGRETFRSGNSEFSGMDLAFSTTLSSAFVTAGVIMKPPMTLQRRFRGTASESGPVVDVEDELSLPWRGSAGIVVRPRASMGIGLEYEWHPYAEAGLMTSGGSEASPWMSSSAFRAGMEYAVLPWLTVRGGMHRGAETFGAHGSALEDDPVWFTAYSVGAGVSLAGAQLNIAFEHRRTTYEDVFAGAVYHNRDLRQLFAADLTYTLNWNR